MTSSGLHVVAKSIIGALWVTHPDGTITTVKRRWMRIARDELASVSSNRRNMRNVIPVLPTRLILTGSLQIIILMSFPVDGAAQSQVEMMRKYLDALKTLDQDALEKFFAPDAVFQRADGTQVPLDRRQNRRFREFERGTHTQWTYRIVGVKRDQVTVILTAQSEYYKLLGVGKRTSMVVYEVRDGLVHTIRTLGQVHESGDEGEAATAFHEWLDHQPAAAGIGLVRDGHLVYDAVSARTMLPWLRKWRSFQNLTNRRISVEQDVGTKAWIAGPVRLGPQN